MNIKEFRAKYPEYDDMSDRALATSFYRKYYANSMTRDDFTSKFGAAPDPTDFEAMSDFRAQYQTPAPEPVPETIEPVVQGREKGYRKSIEDMPGFEGAARRAHNNIFEGLASLGGAVGIEPGATREWFANAGEAGFTSPKKRAVDSGAISNEGAPTSVRLKTSFGGGQGIFTSDEGQFLREYQKQLSSHYGKLVDVTTDEQGEPVFMNPETGKWTYINPLGPDSGDLASMTGDLIGAAPGIAGGVAGSAGGPAGTIAGVGAGEFGGDAARQWMGRLLFDTENEHLWAEAAERGALGALLTGGTQATGATGRWLWNKARGRNGAELALARHLNQTRPQAAQNLRAVREMGDRPPMTTGQLIGDGETLRAEAQISQLTGAGAPVRNVYQQQGQTVAALGNRTAGGPYDPNLGGHAPFNARVQGTVGRQYLDQVDVASRPLAKLKAAQEAAQRHITREAAPRERLGQEIREEVVEPRYQQMQRKTDTAYNNLRNTDGYDDVAVAPERFRGVIARQARQEGRSLVPNARPEDARSVQASAQRLGLYDDAPAPVVRSLDEINSDLSSLRGVVREARTGVPGRAVATNEQQLNALLADRNAAIEAASNPNMARRLGIAEARRTQQGNFERGILGKVIKRKNGEYVVSDEQVLSRLIVNENKDNANAFFDLLDRPEFAAYRPTVRRALADMYADATVSGGRAAHIRFMDRYGDAVRRVYGDDARLFDQVRGLLSVEDSIRAQQQRAVAELNRSGVGVIGRLDADQIYPRLKWNASLTETLQRNADADTWRHFQSLTARDIRDQVMGRIRGERAFSFTKLDDLLADTDKVAYMRQVLGEDYVTQLSRFRDGLRVLQRSPDIPVHRDPNLRQTLIQVARIRFAPLTPRGRALTAFIRGNDALWDMRVGRALADPDRIIHLANIVQYDPRSRAFAESVAAVGLYELLAGPEGDRP